MSTEIDRRVVEMQFNNKDFERNVQQSLGTIEKLKMALNFDGAKGLDSITKAADKVDLSNLSTQTSKVQASFSALQVAGYTMIQDLTRSFMNFGKNLWNMSFGQMKSGGMGRALKIEQANFKMKALAKNIDDVKNGLITADELIGKMADSIDKSVTGTAYGYDSAANVASQLMASGLTDAEKMYTYLRGIAGAAAMTGRTFDDIGNIFATVSANGKLMTMQLRQFSAAGLNASATLAQQLGYTEAQINEMVTKGKISFEDFASAMYEAFGESAGKADETYAGVLSNVKAQLSRLGQRFAVPYIENMIPFLQKLKAAIKELSATLAPVADRFNGIFGSLTRWGANVLENINYQKFTIIFRGIENLAWGVIIVLRTLKEAFISVFPAKTTDQILDAAYAFERFTEGILPTKEAVAGIKGLFMALLAPVKIIVKLFSTLTKHVRPIIVAVMKIVYAFASVFEILEPVVAYLLDFIDEMGILDGIITVVTNAIVYFAVCVRILVEVFVKLVKQIAYSERMKTFGEFIKDIAITIATYLVNALVFLVDLIDQLINRLQNAEKGTGFFDQLIINAQILWGVITGLANAFATWLNTYDSASGMKSIINFFKELGSLIKNFATGKSIKGNIDNISLAIQTLKTRVKEMWEEFKYTWDNMDKGRLVMLLFAVSIIAVTWAVKGLIDNISGFVKKMTNIPAMLGDIRDAIQSLGNFTGPTQAILAFSGAVAVITTALVTLSNIEDTEKLKAAAIALGSISGGLFAFVLALEYFSKKVNIGTEAVINNSAVTLLAMTGSILALTQALKVLAELQADTDSILRAVGVLVTMMASMIVSMKVLAVFVPELTKGSVAFLAFAASIYILIGAIKKLDGMQFERMGETLSGLATIMIGFGFAVGLAGKASGIASLAIMSFTTSIIVLFGLFAILAYMPYELIQNAVEKATMIINSFIPLIMSVGIATRVAGASNGAKLGGNLWAFVLGITAFLGMFTIFAYVTKDMYLGDALATMAALTMLIGALVAGLILVEGMVANAATNSRNTLRNAMNAKATFDSLSKVLIGIGVAMLGIGIAAKLMENTTPAQLVAIGVYLAIIGGIIIAMEAITKRNVAPPGKSIFNIIALTTGMSLIIAALVALQFADSEKLVIAATAITVCMLALAMVISAIASVPDKSVRKVGKATLLLIPLVLAMGALFGAAVYSLRQVSDIPGSTMYAFAISTSILLGTMGMIVGGFSNIPSANYKNALMGIGSMAMILPIVAALMTAMFAVTQIPKGEGTRIAKYLALGLGALLAYVGIVVIMSKLATKLKVSARSMLGLAGAMDIISLSFVEIAGALYITKMAFDGLEDTQLATMIGSLAALFLELMVALALFAAMTMKIKGYDFAIVGGAMSIMALALMEIAEAFAIMKRSGASADEIKSYALVLGILIAVVGGLSAVIGYFAPAAAGLVALSIGFIAIGSASKGVGEGILFVAQAIQILGNTTTGQVNNMIDNVKLFLNRFGEIARAYRQAWPDIVDTIRTTMLSVATLIGTFVGLLTAVVIQSFVKAIVENLDVILAGVTLILGTVAAWLRKEETLNMIHDSFAALAEAALAGLSGLVEGLTGIKTQVHGFIMDLIAEISDPAVIENFDDWKDATSRVQNAMRDYAMKGYENLTDQERLEYDRLSKTMEGLMKKAVEEEYYLNYGEHLGLSNAEQEAKAYEAMWYDMYENLEGDAEAFEREMWAILNNSGDDYINYLDYIISDINAKRFGDDVTEEAKEFGSVMNNILQEYKRESQEILTTDQELERNGVFTHDYSNNYAENIDSIDNLGHSHRVAALSINDAAYEMLQFEIVTEQTRKKVYPVLNTMHDISSESESAAESIGELNNSFNFAITDPFHSGEAINRLEVLKDTTEQTAQGGAHLVTVMRAPIKPNINAAGLELLNDQINISNNNIKGLKKSTQEAIAANLNGMANTGKIREDVKLSGDAIENTGNATDEVTTSTNNLSNALDNLSASASNAKKSMGGWLGELLSDIPGLQETKELIDQYYNVGNEEDNSDKDADWWRAHGMEMVPYDISGGGHGYRHRYEEEYKDIESYVNANAKYGSDRYTDLFGEYEKKMDEASDAAKNNAAASLENANALDELSGESKKASKKVDKLRDSIAGCLDIFTEFNSTTKLTSKDVFKTFMNQIEGVSDWTNMMTGLAEKGLSIDILEMLESEGPKSYDKVNAIYNMSSNEIAMLNAMYADSFELINNSTESIDKAAQNIEALTLDNLKDNIEETIVSFEKFDDETKVVLTRLQELEDGGNVNLLMRPAIDTEELNKLGYDAGDGFATMFTSTVSNEAGTIAMNFTPIIVDPKTGKYLGTMSPDKFDNYCNDVLEGVRKDDLNLKVGMTFNGDNAIEEASKAAEEIHNLHEQLGEDWGKDSFANFEVTTVTKEFTDGICEGIENGTDDIRNTMSNYGHAALEALRKELKFEEALEGVKEFRDELSKTISGAMNIFEELSDEEEISSEKMLHNMTDQVKRVGRWATYMAQLAGRGMSEGLLEELRELGPAGYAKVESFVKMTDAQLSKANSLYESSSKVGNYGADKIVSSYANAGYNASLGFKEGVDTDAAKDVMIQLATKSLSSLEKALGIESPSKMMMQDGVYAIQGFILGLQDEESYSLLEESLIGLSDKSINILKSDLAGNKIINVSVNCLKGLSNGFKQNIKMVVDTAHYVASKIINAFNETLKIASPSEEFAWAAEMCNLGFAEAMNSDDTAVVATEDKANDIRNILAEKFLNIGDAVGDDGVYEPVIRPVWDMSDIQAGFNTIDNYMSSRSIRLNAVDAVANRNGLSQDTIAITNAIRDISMDQKAIRQELANLRTDTVNLGSRIDGMSVYLDGSALVGQIVNPMDQAMGAKVVRQKRRKG